MLKLPKSFVNLIVSLRPGVESLIVAIVMAGAVEVVSYIGNASTNFTLAGLALAFIGAVINYITSSARNLKSADFLIWGTALKQLMDALLPTVARPAEPTPATSVIQAAIADKAKITSTNAQTVNTILAETAKAENQAPAPAPAPASTPDVTGKGGAV